MKKIIVTGVNGFVGQHLVKELTGNGHSVIGVGGAIGNREQIFGLENYLELDLTKPEEAAKIDFAGVNGVVHLAGLAAVGPSFDDPMLYMLVNQGIQINLFETALKQDAKPKFIVISSGTLYDPKSPLPLKESSKVDPNSPYAVSKIGQEQLGLYYQSRGFEVVIARPFNHIGPGQGLGFIVPDLASQIVDCERGNSSQISVGNLDAKRDYTDVRDIVRAYSLLLDSGKSGETYNICTGKALSGHEILAGLTTESTVEPEVVEDPAKMRPSDTPEIYGSYEKIKSDTGWQPEHPLEQTFRDVLEFWRSK